MQRFDRQPTFQVTRVWAKNFRSIADTSADLDQLTVLVGPNASGKSNLLDILRFVKDALRFDLEAALAMRHGIRAISRHDHGPSSPMQIGLSATIRGSGPNLFYSIEYGFTLASTSDGGYVVADEYGLIHQTPGGESDVVKFRVEHGRLVEPHPLVPEDEQRPLFRDEGTWTFDNSELAFPTLLRITRRASASSAEALGLSELSTNRALNRMYRALLGMRLYHIFPNTIREPQKLGNASPLDEDAGNLASALREMEREEPDLMARLKDSLGLLIPGVSDLEVSSAGGYLVVRLQHETDLGQSWFDLSQESDGTVRLLGLLTALYQGRTLPLIGIEEPELAVHPGALAVLADLLNEASSRFQVVVTTHSPDFIDCITEYKTTKSIRVVELVDGSTEVVPVSEIQEEAVRQQLFSPGELHRMGELKR